MARRPVLPPPVRRCLAGVGAVAAVLAVPALTVPALAFAPHAIPVRASTDAAETHAAVPHSVAALPAGAPRLAIARLQYDGGGDWYANPSSLPNLLAAIAERTALPVERTEGRVRLTDEALFGYPFLHATGHGEMVLSPAEIERLREYLTRGGFLHVDDNYGLDASVRRVIAQLFPDRPLVTVPASHPVYHVVYDLPGGLPKIHEHDGQPAEGLGIFLGDRLAVFYSYSSDLGNGWEDIGTHAGDPPALHERAIRMGVNLFVYAVTSRVAP